MSGRTTVLVMGGEGIGPEITAQGVKVLRAAARRFRLEFDLTDVEVGLRATERTGSPFPPDAEAACDALCGGKQGAILFGAVSDEPIGILRKKYDLFANLRPIRAMKPLL